MSIDPLIRLNTPPSSSSDVRGASGSAQDAETFRTALESAMHPSGARAMKEMKAAAEVLRLQLMQTTLLWEDADAASPLIDFGRYPSLLQGYGASRKIDSSPEALPSVKGAVSGGRAPSDPVDRIITRAADRYSVAPELVRAVVQAESDFNPKAVSPAGAEGLMQLMPGTAREMGVRDSFDPEQNVMGGARYLRQMLDRYDGDLEKALAAYNWGPGNLDRSDGTLPEETRRYVSKIKGLLRQQV